MNIGEEGEEDNNNKKEKETEAWRGRICSLNGGQKRAVEDDGNFRGEGEGFFPVLVRDTMGCFVLFIFMDLGQRVSTLTLWMGRGLRGEVKPERGW